jgi:hypothetical protein
MPTFPRMIFCAVFLIGSLATSATADTLYTYTGDPFMFAQGVYSPGDRITGTFVLSGSFVPINGVGPQSVTNFVESYSFTDGHQILTQANSTATFRVPFDLNGSPIGPGSLAGGILPGWTVDIRSLAGGLSTDTGGDYIVYAWTGATANPLPSSCFGGIGPISCNFASSTSVALINSTGPSTLYDGGPGIWTVHTPEEGTTLLFLLSGLAGLTLLRRFLRRES